MRRYVLVSGIFLSVLTVVQLLRVVMRWPVTVAGMSIPTWVSLIAAAVLGTLAIWAFRVLGAKDSAAA
jgi:hypothetical protein